MHQNGKPDNGIVSQQQGSISTSFSDQNKALELLFFTFEFYFCANTLCGKTVEDYEHNKT